MKLKALKQLDRKVFVDNTASEKSSPTELQKVSLHSFVDKVVAFVETRFQFLKQSPFSHFQVFDYHDHPATSDEDFASHGYDDIVALCRHFEGILAKDVAHNTIGQWPEPKLILSRKRRRCPFEMYISLMADTPEGLASITSLMRLCSRCRRRQQHANVASVQ